MRSTISSARTQRRRSTRSSLRYLRTYAGPCRTLAAPVGPARAGARLRARHGALLAREAQLAARLRPMFLILERNREWWAKAGPPGSGARLHVRRQPGDLPVLPGQGPPAPSARELREAERLLAGPPQRRSALAGSRTSSARRSSATASSPGSTTSTSAAARRPGSRDGAGNGDAGARAGASGSPTRRSWRRGAAPWARSSAGPRAGCGSPQSSDDWYALYSFAPRMNVLNGMLQAVNGLRTYAEIAGDSGRGGSSRRATDGARQDRRLRHRRLVALQPALVGHRAGGEPQLPHAQPRLRAQPVPRDQCRWGLLHGADNFTRT